MMFGLMLSITPMLPALNPVNMGRGGTSIPVMASVGCVPPHGMGKNRPAIEALRVTVSTMGMTAIPSITPGLARTVMGTIAGFCAAGTATVPWMLAQGDDVVPI